MATQTTAAEMFRKSLERKLANAKQEQVEALDRMAKMVARRLEDVNADRFYPELNMGNMAAEIARYSENCNQLTQQLGELNAMIEFAS